MGGLFYNLGRIAGPRVRKAKWVLRSLTGTEADVIQAEFEVGRDMAQELAAEADPESDPVVVQMLVAAGDRLTSRLTNRKRQFTFRAIRSAEVNAFALPGGFIYVTRRLLDLCRMDQDEVAFVLGHEMAHVVKGHAMDRIVNQSVMSIASKMTHATRAMRHKAVQVGLGLLRSAYSQDQELEADAFSVQLTRSAAFDPRAGERVLARLKAEGDSSGAGELATYFSSHPPLELRIVEIRRVLRRMGL